MMFENLRAPWLLDYAYAHRGLWRAGGAPENSIAAFEAAVRAGLGVELDVRIAADGEPIVFHDATLDRMTKARGQTNSRTAAELSRLRLANTDETVPTLAEALEAMGDFPVLVEMKVNRGSEGPLERRVAQILMQHAGPCAVMSFNSTSLIEFESHAPEIACGQLCEGWGRGRAPMFPWSRRAAVRDFLASLHITPDFLACEVSALDAFGQPAALSLHVPLLAWTIRTRAQIERAERAAHALIFENLDPGLVKPSQPAFV